jgi:hypothetical protein
MNNGPILNAIIKNCSLYRENSLQFLNLYHQCPLIVIGIVFWLWNRDQVLMKKNEENAKLIAAIYELIDAKPSKAIQFSCS